ncbi:MAG: peptidoglycan-binding protein [Brachybacterium tyrofermentans]|uniref:peptidoglycan-binding protein n=1 Tax=Brachybacterium tyrofermentans TaxID=47848 RepID=UPI003F902C43
MATAYASLPASWSNKRKVERLRADAFASLTRMLPRAVAETGVNFSIYSALRTTAEQHALFIANYRNTGKTYPNGRLPRKYKGTYWARKPNSVAVAIPGSPRANHEGGLAIDIHPGAIQTWLKRNGNRFGWDWAEGKRNNEDWHFRYYPGQDTYKSEGLLDHAAVQKAVGADVDGKIGTGTVKLIKAFQKAHGLEVDGKVGPATKKVLLGKGDGAPAPAPAPGAPAGDVPEYTIEHHQTKNLRPGRVDKKRGLTGELNALTLHHWGADGQNFDTVVDWLVADGNGNNHSSAHEVIEGTRVAVLADIADGTWNTGDAQGNLDNYAFECRPEADETTIRTVAARVAAAREEAGWDVPLNLHQDYVATACPGRYVALRDTIDALSRGEDVAVARPVAPTSPVTLPTGKELLVKLSNLPDFPLLRTPGNLCYYGDVSGPKTSVSGKSANSLNPGEIVGTGKSSGAQGLKLWQKQMGLTADGRFGAKTEAAAKALQKKAGLTVDGKIGPSTFHAAWLVG